MKCKDIENLVIESSSERLDEETKEEMERHMKDCVRCARLEEEMAGIRNAFPRQSRPALPQDLDERTYQLCRTEMTSPQREGEVFGGKAWLKSIPFSIKAAFISLIVLTVIWTVPLLRELKLEESLSVAAIILLSLIFQNTVMLIFSPLLLRRFRMKRARFETYSAR
jgi:anti-sigma factor RsiW